MVVHPGFIVRQASRPAVRTALAALAVCLAYYLGANLGFILRFPPATPSVMWPPNAILTAALLLTPPRRWWIYLLAALPAHLAAELGAAWPVSLVLALFVTNCGEALFAAVTVRWLSDAPARFDTVPRVTSFIVGAVLVGPFLSSFLDAAAVTAVQGEPYWLVWQTRFFSNVFTELTLVPALVTLATMGTRRFHTVPRARQAEGGLLGLSLLAIGATVFLGLTDISSVIPGAPGTPLGLLVPFILLAAVRFGPGGASLALMTTALMAIFAATHAHGPFTRLPISESVFALQIFLVIVAIPLMYLTALIEERRRAQKALQERLHFEELLARLSGAFVRLPDGALDDTFETWLQRLAELLGLDRAILFRLTADGREMQLVHAWTHPDAKVHPRAIAAADFPWAFARLRDREVVAFSRPADLPAEAACDADSYRRRGVRSNLTIPLEVGDRVLGGLGFSTLRSERTWPEPLVQQARLIAEVFASAMARREAEDALRGSESMKSAILASLPSSVAVLDREGRIIAVNESWTRFVNVTGRWSPGVGVGSSYLEVWQDAERHGVPHAAEARIGVEAVLDRSRTGFGVEYGGTASLSERWFAMSVVPLNRPEGGAVVSHSDVTERKRAELNAQRSQQELAHFTRVSTVGELTASLAHELNQPLTGILTNAQAARRFLEVTPPDIGELRDIVADIIADDKRAGEVIQRLRELLQKHEAERVPLDLNTLIRDMAKLLSSDALIRKVTVALDLDPYLPLVVGDHVQLQQIVLNLLVNAMESMGEGAGADHALVVRSRRSTSHSVQVTVRDTGPGLREGTQDLVFEPFYTTKSAGIGMGLAIVRSIVDAHGGAIWAENNPTGGASFTFSLPLSGELG